MTGQWAQRSCLVTGGLGFGGSHLTAELLRRCARVVVVDRRPVTASYLGHLGLADAVTVVTGDVRDSGLVRQVLRRHAIDTVFHLAAQPLVEQSVSHPFETLDINATGTFVLLEASRVHPTVRRFVFASSGAFYGGTTTPEPVSETAAPLPATNLYSSSKAGADLAVQGYARTFGMRASVCRFMNTYGPGDNHGSRLVPRALALLASDSAYDFGERDDGTTRLDFLYITDMVRAYLAVADHLDFAEGDVFNFGSGRSTSVRDVAVLVSRLYDGIDREPVFRGTPQSPPRQKWLDIAKAEAVLGWRPTVDLPEGLARTVRWHRGLAGPR